MVKGNKSLCMWQYSSMFAVTRVPLYHCDTLVQADAKHTRHIIVLLRDQVYKLDVYKQQGDHWVLLTTDEIEKYKKKKKKAKKHILTRILFIVHF